VISTKKEVSLPGNIGLRTCVKKSVLCEQLLGILLCMVTVSRELLLLSSSLLLSRQAGFKFQIPSGVFWHAWSSHLPNLALLGYFLWGYIKSKVYRTYPANTDDLKQGICSVFKGSPQKCLFGARTKFPV
jgi:hypothetical protein